MFEKAKNKAKTALFAIGGLLMTSPAFLQAQQGREENVWNLQSIVKKQLENGTIDKCLAAAVDDFKLTKEESHSPKYRGQGKVTDENVSTYCYISPDRKDYSYFPGTIIDFIERTSRPDYTTPFAGYTISPSGELYPVNVDITGPYKAIDFSLDSDTVKKLKEKVNAAYDKVRDKMPARPRVVQQYTAPKNSKH